MNWTIDKHRKINVIWSNDEEKPSKTYGSEFI